MLRRLVVGVATVALALGAVVAVPALGAGVAWAASPTGTGSCTGGSCSVGLSVPPSVVGSSGASGGGAGAPAGGYGGYGSPGTGPTGPCQCEGSGATGYYGSTGSQTEFVGENYGYGYGYGYGGGGYGGYGYGVPPVLVMGEGYGSGSGFFEGSASGPYPAPPGTEWFNACGAATLEVIQISSGNAFGLVPPSAPPVGESWYTAACIDPGTGAIVGLLGSPWLATPSQALAESLAGEQALRSESATVTAQAPVLSLVPSAAAVVNHPELLGIQTVHTQQTEVHEGGIMAIVTLTPESVKWSVSGDTYLGVTDSASFTCPLAASEVANWDMSTLESDPSLAFANAQGGGQHSCSPVPWYAFANMTGYSGETGPAEATVTASVVYSVSWSFVGVATPGDLPSTMVGPSASVSLPVKSAESNVSCMASSACPAS